MAKISTEKRKEENINAGRTATGGGGGAGFFASRPGTVRMRPMNWTIFQTSGKGTPTLGIVFVQLVGPEPGKIVQRDFYLTPGALPMLADFAIAMGYEGDIDTDDVETIKAMLKSGTRSVLSTLKAKPSTDGSKTFIEPSFFFLQDEDTAKELRVNSFDDVKKLSEAVDAKGVMEQYVAWREKHPRKVWDPSKGDPADHRGSGGDGDGGDDSIPF